MLKIGLTGNVCSGMDKVGDLFKTLGVPVFDADVALKFIINYREDVIRLLKGQFGKDIYNNGIIDGSKFNTPKFNVLLDIAQIELLKLYESWRFFNKDASYTIFKSSILFERGLDSLMNYTISSFLPKNERAVEVAKKYGIRLVEACDVVEDEMDELEKNKKATFIIHTYDNLSIISQTRDTHEKIESKSIKRILDKMDSIGGYDPYRESSIRNIFT